MRELHVVALSSDGRHLLLSPKQGTLKGAFLLEISPRLRQALDGELETAGDDLPPAESALSPKEIQARLRAGQSPERVAKAAGVPVQRVTRFFGPVLSERARIIDTARGAVLSRSRRGASAAPLGDAVAANLLAKRIQPPDDAAWDAHRRADGCWVVRLELAVRGRARRAEWVWDPAARSVTAADTYSAALGHVEHPVPRPRPNRGVPARRPDAGDAAAGPARRPRAAKPAPPVKPVKPVKPGKAAAAARAAKPAKAAPAKPAKPPGKAAPGKAAAPAKAARPAKAAPAAKPARAGGRAR